jgi:hypothetical protein
MSKLSERTIARILCWKKFAESSPTGVTMNVENTSHKN